MGHTHSFLPDKSDAETPGSNLTHVDGTYTQSVQQIKFHRRQFFAASRRYRSVAVEW